MSRAIATALPAGSMDPVGVLDPISAVHLMENHDRAYVLWRDAGVRNRILVHIDAHHDMWRNEDDRALSIANFICPALKEDIVRELYWVVPDATWRHRAGREAVRRHVKKIVETYSKGAAPTVHSELDNVRTTVLGRPLLVCSLDSLPVIDEPVLLDIDTDYLTIPSVSYGEWDRHGSLPWRWPADLVLMLEVKGVRSDFVTVAYSVEGGHTPVEWKYLGDELVRRLRRPNDPVGHRVYDRMRDGVIAERRGDASTAESAFRSAGDELGAAPHFWLAHLLVSQGRVEEARGCYQRARSLDPSYRTVFSPGVPLYRTKSYEAAAGAFQRTSQLDPTDVSAQIGLGWIAARGKRWKEAEMYARAALTLQPDTIDGYRLLASALEKQDRVDEAISAYERSLKLGLTTRGAIDSIVVTDPDADRMLDGDHVRTHALLARLYARRRDDKRAIISFRIAISGGYDNPAVRLHLARLCARQRDWDGTIRHVRCAIQIAAASSLRRASARWDRPSHDPTD